MSQIKKITAEQATADGYIDAIAVTRNPVDYDKKAYRTAILHINRYLFTKRFVKNKRVIDAACGTGYGCEILNENNYREYIGIDILRDAINIAKERYKHLKNATFFRDDVTKNSLPIKEFDVFISFETIEHLYDYNAFLKFVFSVLKKDGIFVISTPNREITNPGGSLESKPKWDYHVREWILPEFIELLKNYNFRILKIYGQSFRLKRSISQFLPGIRGILKNTTQRVIPLFPLGVISEPNFYIIICQK